MSNSQENKQVAMTILEQLGGNKFIAMTGSHSFSYDSDLSLTFKTRNAKQGIKAVKISLNGNDTYKMRFIKQKRAPSFAVSDVAVHNEVYFDDLQTLFTKETGLLTKLF